MRIVKIKGGIGNQLFQYAFALNLRKALNEEVKLDFNSCYGCKDITCEDRLKSYNIRLQEATNKEIKAKTLIFNKKPLLTFGYRVRVFLEKTLNKKYFFESTRHYLDINTINKYQYYDVYAQSWKYPEMVKDELYRDIILKNDISQKTSDVIKTIEKTNAVFLGIRRGDYVSSKAAVNRYGTFSNSYYTNAMKYMAGKIKDPVFYIFSNDIEWCKKNIDFSSYNVVFREKEEQVSDLEEFLIMSSCKHAIILNSTFHWWGAFLIKNKDKIVIGPSKWFADGTKVDIIPPEWIKMERNGDLAK